MQTAFKVSVWIWAHCSPPFRSEIKAKHLTQTFQNVKGKKAHQSRSVAGDWNIYILKKQDQLFYVFVMCYFNTFIFFYHVQDNLCTSLNQTNCVIALQVTNHVVRNLSGEVQPGLGVSWSHVPRTRILLERLDRSAAVGTSSRRSATLIKSSRQVRHISLQLRIDSEVRGGLLKQQKKKKREPKSFFSHLDEEAPYL